MYTQMLCDLVQRHDVLHVGAAFGPTPDTWTSSSPAPWRKYIPALRYYNGGLPMVCTAYASSECCFGLNLRPLCDPYEVSYTIMPSLGYFEFLPVDDDMETEEASDKLMELFHVDRAGSLGYFEFLPMVITTYDGLNQYRVDDVLREAGFHNTATGFQSVHRQNVLLSVESDKTDEAELQGAVEFTSTLLWPYGVSVAEYTSHTCTKGIPGHYVIYWEMLVTGAGAGAMDKESLYGCCLEMEEALSVVYRQSRVSEGSIGPLEIRVVWSGTFDELMDYAVSGGASISKYKTPRCMTLPTILELLDSHAVSSHFSTALPWRRRSTSFE